MTDMLGRLRRCANAVGFRCYVVRGRPWDPLHDAARTELGGQRCLTCGRSGADLGAMGLMPGGAHVPPTRRVYDRENGILTRTDAYEPRRGGGF